MEGVLTHNLGNMRGGGEASGRARRQSRFEGRAKNGVM